MDPEDRKRRCPGSHANQLTLSNMPQSCLVYCRTLSFPTNEINPEGKPKAWIYYGYSSGIEKEGILNLESFLSPEEVKRAKRFHFEQDRLNFISARAFVRIHLASNLGCKPQTIEISYTANEKPFVRGSDLHFNVAHSGDLFAIAISESAFTGLDVEKIKKNAEFYTIIKNYFSHPEAAFILENEQQSLPRFYLCWTRKEAFLKSIGTGISEDLTKIQVIDGANTIIIERNDKPLCERYYIHSYQLEDYYMSISLPFDPEIIMKEIASPEDFHSPASLC